ADVSWRGPGENGGVVGLPATEDRGRLVGRESLRRARVDRGRGLEVGAPVDLQDVGGLVGGGRPWPTGTDPHPTVVVTRFGSGVDVARDHPDRPATQDVLHAEDLVVDGGAAR